MKNTTTTLLTVILSTVLVSSIANANETVVKKTTVSTYIKPVCDLYAQKRVNLSKNAIKVCNGNAKKMPVFTKKGDRLKKSRTGGEFNTLISNIKHIK